MHSVFRGPMLGYFIAPFVFPKCRLSIVLNLLVLRLFASNLLESWWKAATMLSESPLRDLSLSLSLVDYHRSIVQLQSADPLSTSLGDRLPLAQENYAQLIVAMSRGVQAERATGPFFFPFISLLVHFFKK